MKLIFGLLQVSTADQCRSSPKALISCNKKSLYLPPEMPAIHIEFTEYYYPDGKDFPSKKFNFLVWGGLFGFFGVFLWGFWRFFWVFLFVFLLYHKFCVLLSPLWSLILVPGWQLEISNGFLKWKECNTAPFAQSLLLVISCNTVFYKYSFYVRKHSILMTQVIHSSTYMCCFCSCTV